ncbi:MAG TPA: hypothetical protein EYQ82_10745 [Dehalococcoidia bacterium]|nr:hypothetical protein [Dehalococcoidia bacterium]
MGTAAALTENLVTALVQTMSSNETRGRVMSILRMADSLNPPGMILGVVLASVFTNEFALVLTAGLAFGVIVSAIGLSKTVRRI